jgi:hypothetical protein
MDESVRLIKIDVLRQPIKRAGVIVLDIDRQNVGCRTQADQQRRCAKRSRPQIHRAA